MVQITSRRFLIPYYAILAAVVGATAYLAFAYSIPDSIMTFPFLVEAELALAIPLSRLIQEPKPRLEVKTARDRERLGFRFVVRHKALHNPEVSLNGVVQTLTDETTGGNLGDLMRVDRPYVLYYYFIEAETRGEWAYVNVFDWIHNPVMSAETRSTQPRKFSGHLTAIDQTLTFNSAELDEELRFDKVWITTVKSTKEGASALDSVEVELLEERELLARGWTVNKRQSWKTRLGTWKRKLHL